MPPPPSESTALSVRAAEAETIARLAREGVNRHAIVPLGATTLLVWPDQSIADLEAIFDKPARKRGSAKLVTPEAFIAYVQNFLGAGTMLTGDATEKGGHFMALMDYHEPLDGAPQWTEHTARLELQTTPEWQRWLSMSCADLDQRRFAEFIEDNAQDITVPEGEAGRGFPNQQELLSVALTLQVKSDVQFGNQVRLQNGQTQLTYVERIEGGHGPEAKMTIPEKFALAIAPFRGLPKYLVTARLRYRAAGGKATFRFEIERPHKIVEHAFTDVKVRLETLLKRTVLVGSVEPQARSIRNVRS